MRRYFILTAVAALLLVGWTIAYFTTYNLGYSAAQTGPQFADTEVAKNGWTQFQAAGCAQCHTVLGQQGQSTGPDLTEVGKRWKADQIKQLIRNPRSIFPNTVMPAFGSLSDDQVGTIATYLETLK